MVRIHVLFKKYERSSISEIAFLFSESESGDTLVAETESMAENTIEVFPIEAIYEQETHNNFEIVEEPEISFEIVEVNNNNPSAENSPLRKKVATGRTRTGKQTALGWLLNFLGYFSANL